VASDKEQFCVVLQQVSKEAKEYPLLEGITKKRLVKTAN
jgi:hypothetical protein